MTTTHVNGNPGPGLYDRHKMVAGLISSWYLSPPHLDVWISNSHTDISKQTIKRQIFLSIICIFFYLRTFI
jgi:hypothetical protein